MEYLDIPWTVIDSSFPLKCVIALKEMPVQDISKGVDPKIDMQSMVAAYRSINDAAHGFNSIAKPCLAALQEQKKNNELLKKKYCEDRSYYYDSYRGVCTIKEP